MKFIVGNIQARSELYVKDYINVLTLADLIANETDWKKIQVYQDNIIKILTTLETVTDEDRIYFYDILKFYGFLSEEEKEEAIPIPQAIETFNIAIYNMSAILGKTPKEIKEGFTDKEFSEVGLRLDKIKLEKILNEISIKHSKDISEFYNKIRAEYLRIIDSIKDKENIIDNVKKLNEDNDSNIIYIDDFFNKSIQPI